jgi:hypothetical protein
VFVVEPLIYSHRLILLLLFLERPEFFVFSGKFRQAPARLQRSSADGSVWFFSCFSTWFLCIRRVLPVAGMFYLSPASFGDFFFLSFQ